MKYCPLSTVERQRDDQPKTTPPRQGCVVNDRFSFLSFSTYRWILGIQLQQNKRRYNFLDFPTNTKHCKVQGSGQDRELEVGQSIRTATEQKPQTSFTNPSFSSLSLEAVRNVIYSHLSVPGPVSVSRFSRTVTNTFYMNPYNI